LLHVEQVDSALVSDLSQTAEIP